MQSKEPHISTAYIALICSVLGWVSWGVIAIPGVIIAHTVKSNEPSTAVVIKAALRVGYAAILFGLAGFITLAVVYLGFVSRLKVALGFGEPSYFSGSTASGALLSSEGSDRMIANWAWTGGIFLVTVIAFVLMLPLIRKWYARFQSARILRSNSMR